MLPAPIARLVGFGLLALGGALLAASVWFIAQPSSWGRRFTGLHPLAAGGFAVMLLILGAGIERDGRAPRKAAAAGGDAAGTGAGPQVSARLPTLTQPVESTWLPTSVTRLVAIACLVGSGVLLILAVVVFFKSELFRFSPLNLLMGAFVMLGFGVAIDRDRLKEEKRPVKAQPPAKEELP